MKLIRLSLLLLTSSISFAQDTLDCNTPNNEVLFYCNDYNTGTINNPGTFINIFEILDLRSVGGGQGFYTTTETKDSNVTVQGLSTDVFLAGSNIFNGSFNTQVNLDPTVVNRIVHQASDPSNVYSISLKTSRTDNSTIFDDDGSSKIILSFDIKDINTNYIYPYIDIQLDLAPGVSAGSGASSYRSES